MTLTNTKVGSKEPCMAAMFALLLLTLASSTFADEDIELVQLEHAWVHANFETPESEAEAAFKPLSDTAHQYTLHHTNNPQAMIWEAIILSGYAEAKGGLAALRLATQARDLLLSAEKLNPSSMQCELYFSLGALYSKVPNRPLGFGDKEKAQHYFLKALQIDPNHMDANFFYGDFLNDQGEYAKALVFLNKALEAHPRSGFEDLDRGRKEDVQAAIVLAQRKLHH